MIAITLFVATFATVLLTGLQQLNVQHGHKVAAAVTSPLLASAFLVLFKLLPGTTTHLEVLAHFAGGALGIVASMWLHPRAARFIASRWAAPNPAEPGPARITDDHRVGERERLAAEIADDCARSDIEMYCAEQRLGARIWYDTRQFVLEGAEIESGVARALQYLDLAGGMVRHPVQTHLVRFGR
jgi:hypothetical protein